MEFFHCPACKGKPFTVFKRSKLFSGDELECEQCHQVCRMPSLWRLFVSILIAFLMPTVFIIFLGLFGLVLSFLATSVVIGTLYFLILYLSPLELKQAKQRGKSE